MKTYATAAAADILRRKGVTIDAELITRSAGVETKPLTALQQLALHRKNRPIVFDSAAEANAYEHRELVLLNQLHKEHWASKT